MRSKELAKGLDVVLAIVELSDQISISTKFQTTLRGPTIAELSLTIARLHQNDDDVAQAV